jgi:hypothetical protein
VVTLLYHGRTFLFLSRAIFYLCRGFFFMWRFIVYLIFHFFLNIGYFLFLFDWSFIIFFFFDWTFISMGLHLNSLFLELMIKICFFCLIK